MSRGGFGASWVLWAPLGGTQGARTGRKRVGGAGSGARTAGGRGGTGGGRGRGQDRTGHPHKGVNVKTPRLVPCAPLATSPAIWLCNGPEFSLGPARGIPRSFKG
eukprot:9050215-Pyramimonas_sp.AAC.1